MVSDLPELPSSGAPAGRPRRADGSTGDDEAQTWAEAISLLAPDVQTYRRLMATSSWPPDVQTCPAPDGHPSWLTVSGLMITQGGDLG
jgi:hypothetical protein